MEEQSHTVFCSLDQVYGIILSVNNPGGDVWYDPRHLRRQIGQKNCAGEVKHSHTLIQNHTYTCSHNYANNPTLNGIEGLVWTIFKALNNFLSYFCPGSGSGMVIDLKYIGFEIDEELCCFKKKVVETVSFNQENQGPLEKSK